MTQSAKGRSAAVCLRCGELTVVVIGVGRLLSFAVVALSPLSIPVASTRLSVESLLFENLLLPGRWGRAGVVVETWEEVGDLRNREDGARAHVDGKVLLHGDLNGRGGGHGGGVRRRGGRGGRRGWAGGGGRGDGQVGC